MPGKAAEANEGEAGKGGAQKGSVRIPLPEAREKGLYQDPEVRERIMVGTLVAAGELGYRQLTVAAVLERYGGHRVQFYRHFANVGEAYEAGCISHIERLELGLLAAAATAASWRARLRAALAELARFAGEDPALASGLLIQIHVAGGPALEQRQEVLERLSRAVDSARRETRSRHSPPPLTAALMVSAIESAVVKALATGEPARFEQAVPELEQLVSSAYFGHGIDPV